MSLCLAVVAGGYNLAEKYLKFVLDKSTACSMDYNLQGNWSYEGESYDGEYRIKGTCFIRQDGKDLTIWGVREETTNLVNGEAVTDTTDYSWKTNWAAMTKGCSLRFDYDIAVQGVRQLGYCVTELEKPNPDILKGDFFELYPGNVSGNVTFERKDD